MAALPTPLDSTQQSGRIHPQGMHESRWLCSGGSALLLGELRRLTALSRAARIDIVRRLAELDLVVVGGQAVAFWREYYLHRANAAELPNTTSKDIDYLGHFAHAEAIARAFPEASCKKDGTSGQACQAGRHNASSTLQSLEHALICDDFAKLPESRTFLGGGRVRDQSLARERRLRWGSLSPSNSPVAGSPATFGATSLRLWRSTSLLASSA